MSIVRHAASGLIGYALPLLAGIVSVPFYLITLGADRYGIFILLVALLGYAASLDLGTGKAATFLLAQRRAAHTGNSNPQTPVAASGVAITLVACIPLCAVLFLGIDQLTALLPGLSSQKSGELVAAVMLTILALPATALLSFLAGVYQGELRFFRLNAIQAVGGISLQLAPLTACWLLAARVDVAMAAVLTVRIGMVIALVCWLIPGARSTRNRIVLNSAVAKELIRYGRWPAVINLLASLITTGDRFVVSHLGGAAAVPAYTIPFDLANRVMIIAGSVSASLFPSLAEQEADAKRKTEVVAAALMALLTPAMAGMIILLYPFLQLWIGADLADRGWMVGEVITVGVWATAIGALAQTRLLAADRGSLIAINYAIQVPIFFLAIYLGMKFFGLVGVAAVWALRCYIDAAVMLALSGDGFGLLKKIWPQAIILMSAIIVASLRLDMYPLAIAAAVICGAGLLLSRTTALLVARRLLAR